MCGMKHSYSPSGVSKSMVNPSKLIPASAPVAAELCQDSLAKLTSLPVPVVGADVSGPIEGPPPAESIPEETRTAVAAVTIAEADAMMLTQPQREAIIQLTSGATRSAATAAAGLRAPRCTAGSITIRISRQRTMRGTRM
jgi:hypothetical protein